MDLRPKSLTNDSLPRPWRVACVQNVTRKFLPTRPSMVFSNNLLWVSPWVVWHPGPGAMMVWPIFFCQLDFEVPRWWVKCTTDVFWGSIWKELSKAGRLILSTATHRETGWHQRRERREPGACAMMWSIQFHHNPPIMGYDFRVYHSSPPSHCPLLPSKTSLHFHVVCMCVWQSEDNLWDLLLSLHHVDSRDWQQWAGWHQAWSHWATSPALICLA